MSKKEKQADTNPTVAFRVSPEVRDFYQTIADRERRKLSQVLRFVLEKHARLHNPKAKQAA